MSTFTTIIQKVLEVLATAIREEKKLQANITDEHRCNNPQQNVSKQYLATHQEAHTPSSSWIYSRNKSILQYMQNNQCDTPC